jgi:hypothetical protein
MCDVYSFNSTALPGSLHLVASGFGVACLPVSDETKAFVAAGASHPRFAFLGVTWRRMDCSVGLAVSTDAAIAALGDDCFEAMKLQILFSKYDSAVWSTVASVLIFPIAALTAEAIHCLCCLIRSLVLCCSTATCIMRVSELFWASRHSFKSFFCSGRRSLYSGLL